MKNREVEISERKILVTIVEVVVCTSRVVKMKGHLLFCREFTAYLVLKIEFLLTVLLNFKREAALKDSAF